MYDDMFLTTTQYYKQGKWIAIFSLYSSQLGPGHTFLQSNHFIANLTWQSTYYWTWIWLCSLQIVSYRLTHYMTNHKNHMELVMEPLLELAKGFFNPLSLFRTHISHLHFSLGLLFQWWYSTPTCITIWDSYFTLAFFPMMILNIQNTRGHVGGFWNQKTCVVSK
jgi:hypothetical protein